MKQHEFYNKYVDFYVQKCCVYFHRNIYLLGTLKKISFSSKTSVSHYLTSTIEVPSHSKFKMEKTIAFKCYTKTFHYVRPSVYTYGKRHYLKRMKNLP